MNTGDSRTEAERCVQVEAVRGSEPRGARDSDFYEIAPVGCLTVDQSGVILRANSTAAKLLGMNREDLVMRPLSCFIRSEGADQQDLPKEGWVASVGSGDRELRMMRGDGEWFWADLKSIAFRAGDDDLVHVIFSDITTRKNTDEALRDSEDVFRQIVHSAEEGIWKINAASLTDYVNPKMAQMMGYAPEEMLGRPIDDFLDDEGRAQLAELIERRKGGIAEQFEFKYLRKDGSTLWAFVSTNPIINANGQYVGAVALLTDMTALRNSEQRFLRALEATEDGVWEWNILDNEVFMSTRWCEIIGYSADDPELPHTYSSWEERIHPDDLAKVRRTLSDHLEKDTEYDVEYRHRHRSGEYRWQNSRGKAVRDESGRPTTMVGCIADITGRKRVEEALRESEELYRLLADHTDDIVGLNDTEGNRLYISPSYFRKTGWTKEDMNNRDWRFVVHPDDIELVSRARDDNIAGKATRIKIASAAGTDPGSGATQAANRFSAPMERCGGCWFGPMTSPHEKTSRRSCGKPMKSWSDASQRAPRNFVR